MSMQGNLVKFSPSVKLNFFYETQKYFPEKRDMVFQTHVAPKPLQYCKSSPESTTMSLAISTLPSKKKLNIDFASL